VYSTRGILTIEGIERGTSGFMLGGKQGRQSGFLWLLGALLAFLSLSGVVGYVTVPTLTRKALHLRDKLHMDIDVHNRISAQMSSDDISFIRILSAEEAKEIVSPPIPPEAGFSANVMDSLQFGTLFYQCAPYIASHRGTTVVLHINGQIFSSKNTLEAVIQDIGILHLLGVHLILVLGVRELLDERIKNTPGRSLNFHEGIRVTDSETLKDIKELSGYARFEIESSLARGFSGKPGNSGINVVSGNFFYSGKPFGVRNGMDYQFSGEVRRIEVENIQKRVSQGDIVLLSSLGYSPSGEVFNVNSESLAAECAAQMKANKLVFFTDGQRLQDMRSNGPLQSLSLRQASALLQQWKQNSSTGSRADSSVGSVSSFMRLVDRAVAALSKDVRRAHLISPTEGTLLKELYSRDGAGMLISRDVYEGIRQAEAAGIFLLKTTR
jgi:amino-acid N-acetyltransferase